MSQQFSFLFQDIKLFHCGEPEKFEITRGARWAAGAPAAHLLTAQVKNFVPSAHGLLSLNVLISGSTARPRMLQVSNL